MKPDRTPPEPIRAHRILFAAAAIHAVVLVPFWVFAYGRRPAPVPLPPYWHGHEAVEVLRLRPR